MDPLSDDNIKNFCAAWYLALDIHAPAKDCEKLLADQDLELGFPEKTMRSFSDFEGWLDFIYKTFFDEVHNVHSVTVKSKTADTADIDVVVAWQASWFTPPAAKSKRTSMNAIQRWTVQKSDKNEYGLVILKYYVDRFDYAPGFAQL